MILAQGSIDYTKAVKRLINYGADNIMNKKFIPVAIIILLAVLYVGASAYIKQRIVSEINDFTASAGFSEEIKYESLSVNPVSMSGKLKQVSFNDTELKFNADEFSFNVLSNKGRISNLSVANGEETINIDEIDILKFEKEDGVPKSVDINVTALHLPISDEEIKSKLGKDEVTVDIQISTNADFKNMVYEYSKLNFLAEGLGDMKMNLTFSGVDIKSYSKYSSANPDSLQNNEEFSKKVQEDISKLKINSLKVELTDKGFIEKLFLQPEEGDNSTIEERRQKLMEGADEKIAEIESPFEKQFSEDMKNFILEGKKEIIVTMNPAEPVSLQQIMLSSMMNGSVDEIVGMTGLKYEMK